MYHKSTNTLESPSRFLQNSIIVKVCLNFQIISAMCDGNNRGGLNMYHKSTNTLESPSRDLQNSMIARICLNFPIISVMCDGNSRGWRGSSCVRAMNVSSRVSRYLSIARKRRVRILKYKTWTYCSASQERQ